MNFGVPKCRRSAVGRRRVHKDKNLRNTLARLINDSADLNSCFATAPQAGYAVPWRSRMIYPVFAARLDVRKCLAGRQTLAGCHREHLRLEADKLLQQARIARVAGIRIA